MWLIVVTLIQFSTYMISTDIIYYKELVIICDGKIAIWKEISENTTGADENIFLLFAFEYICTEQIISLQARC